MYGILLADPASEGCPLRVRADRFSDHLDGVYSVASDDWSSERVVYRHDRQDRHDRHDRADASGGCIWWNKPTRSLSKA